ncbi:hypothetical protein N5U14_05260 [Aliarcobacter butzleri]|uniref:hypothetical protein n=1 Tax=Aliarcobacter butzleri TaxID=28197 RepID=UPI0021B49ECE|nr:hypothetical protein [Aliarcobacter butzleri]MCT7610245.1 hypothetical protein [Aliarcobacter butzleri]
MDKLDFNELNFDFEIYTKFSNIKKELEYLEKSITFLDDTLSVKLKEMEKDFQNDINSIYLLEYDSEFYDNYPNKNLPNEMILENLGSIHEELTIEHDSLMGHIIQAILVRQIAVIEKFLKGLYTYIKVKNPSIEISLTFWERVKKDGIRKFFCDILCLKNKNEKTFSDINKIVEALKKETGINIKKLNTSYWMQLRTMNELRNKFAHGANEFIIGKGLFNDLKQQFGNDFITEKMHNNDIYLCKIENNFKPLIIFNKNMQDYVIKMHSEFRKYFNIIDSGLPNI